MISHLFSLIAHPSLPSLTPSSQPKKPKQALTTPPKLQTNTMKSLHVTFAELRTIVTSNDKQRFSLIPITEGPSSADPPASNATPTNDTTPPSGPSSFPDDPSAYLIRANQGHSITTVDSASLLAPLSPASAPALCVHGTTAAAWPRILASGGLRPMGRNHVHLATGLPAGFTPLDDGATTNSEGEKEKKGEEVVQAPVISGMRNSSRILVYVDVGRAMGAGVPFWRSANGVVLTEGGKDGVLGVEFFERVEDRRAGVVLVRDGVVVGDGGVEGMKGDQEEGKGGRGGGGRRRGGWKDGRRGGAGEAF